MKLSGVWSCATMEPHVVAKIADCARYEALNPHFGKAFAFLRRADLADLKPGRYEIDGDNCWAIISDVSLTPLAGAKVEAHRKYIDIQAPITGPETIGFFTMDAAHRALRSTRRTTMSFSMPRRNRSRSIPASSRSSSRRTAPTPPATRPTANRQSANW